MSNIDGIFCRKCGASLANGYSWNGWCVVCAEPHVKAAQSKGPKWLADAIEKALQSVHRERTSK